MAITAAQVKELREMTGAGMMDCKKALTATDGDMDKAVEFLREKGLATAQKKASRIAAEGLCKTLVTEDGKKAVVVEVNAETDFVAKNEKLQGYVADVAAQAFGKLVGQHCALDGGNRQFLPSVLGAFGGQFAQNHLRVVHLGIGRHLAT